MVHATKKERTYHFGLLLAEILKKKNIKQKELSEKTGFSEPYISLILSEKKKPDFTTLEKLCDALNVDIGYFLLMSICRDKIPKAPHDEFVHEHIIPFLEDLNKVLYQTD